MNKIIVFIMLLTISAASLSQQTNPSPALTKQDYLQKSKKQKTAAWILLVGGTAFAITGYAVWANSALDELGSVITTGHNDKTNVTGAVIFFTGVAAMIGSIPVFIAAGKNKGKGLSLAFKNEMTPQIQKNSFVYRSVPSLTLKINL
jgi:hypothetical protein